MGNICIYKQENKKAKIIKINGYPRLNYPNKRILVPSIQNLSQNLDTFDEDFFKSEFILDFQPDANRNQSTRKVQLGSTLEEINKLNLIQCPSLCHIDEQQDFNQVNQFNLIALHKNHNDVNQYDQKQIKRKKRKPKLSQQKQLEQPKSILKTRHSSHNSCFDVRSQRTVTFSLFQNKTRNSRSLSPMITPFSMNNKKIEKGSMSYLQKFRYF